MFWLPVFTLWRRELIRFWREKSRVFGFVGSPLIFWLLIGSGFGDLAFFFPGALILTVMFSAVFSTMSLIEDRREGFILSMLVSPAPRVAVVLGKTLGSATLAWLQGLLFLLFLPLTGLRPGTGDLVAATVFLFVISFAFTSMGFLLAWRTDSTQGFHAIMNLVLFPLWLVSGAVFPAHTAHCWIHWLMAVNPLTYAVSALRILLGASRSEGMPDLGFSIVITAAMAALLLAAAASSVRERNARSFA
jgi:ABC-type multidrug transport system, permease component